MRIEVADTASLNPSTLASARSLLDDAFAGTFTDDDWEHSVGGAHVLAWDDAQLVGHASVVARRLLVGTIWLRAGYCEALAVSASHRGRRIGALLMDEVERITATGFDFGALSTTALADDFYRRRGWTRWLGTTWAMTPAGRTRTDDDDGGIWVRPGTAPLDVSEELTCDQRAGDPW